MCEATMTAHIVTVRFESGTEFWSTEHPPRLGEAIVRGGRRFLVTDVDQRDEDAVVVTVTEVEDALVAVPEESGAGVPTAA